MWLNETIRNLTAEGKDPSNAYAIMMDTDTILNARPLQQVWAKFDCARKGKPILMGGETGCWFGLPCKQRHVNRYYEPLGSTQNTFVNSGYIMGSLPALQVMFSFISNNYDYFRRIIYWINYFCDQSAYTFFYGNNRDMVQIDEHQQIFATMSVFMEGGHKPASTCRSITSNTVVVMNCSEVLYPVTLFSVDPHTCILSTDISHLSVSEQPLHDILLPYMQQMSPDPPLVFHGNAKGKLITILVKPLVHKCLRTKYNITNFSGKFIVDQLE